MVLQVPSSARSSFSTRFLARANLSSLRSSVMSPGEWGGPRKIDALLEGAGSANAEVEGQELQYATNPQLHQVRKSAALPSKCGRVCASHLDRLPAVCNTWSNFCAVICVFHRDPEICNRYNTD